MPGAFVGEEFELIEGAGVVLGLIEGVVGGLIVEVCVGKVVVDLDGVFEVADGVSSILGK